MRNFAVFMYSMLIPHWLVLKPTITKTIQRKKTFGSLQNAASNLGSHYRRKEKVLEKAGSVI